QDVHQVLGVDVDRAGDERRLRRQRQRDRVDRLVDRAVGGRLVHLAQLAGGRVLALGEAVDPVVEQQDLDVHVPAQRVDQVVAADRQRVAVAGGHPHLELGVGDPDAGGHRRSAPVDRVEAVGVDVVREAAGAADARHHHHLVLRESQLREDLLRGVQDRVVPAAGAPADLLVALEVLLGVDGTGRRLGRRRGDHYLHSFSMTSISSETRNGLPWTLLTPLASTRNFARRRNSSCPRFISGTRTFLYLERTLPRLTGNGLRWRRWARATLMPRRWQSSTAARVAPYVDPQPITSVWASSGPWTLTSGISCTMRWIFAARTRHMNSWFSGS